MILRSGPPPDPWSSRRLELVDREDEQEQEVLVQTDLAFVERRDRRGRGLSTVRKGCMRNEEIKYE